MIGQKAVQAYKSKLLFKLTGDNKNHSYDGDELTDTSAGSAYYIHPTTGELVTVAATEVLNHPVLGITSLPNFEQFLVTPLVPANQTTASLGTGEYYLWITGGGSVFVAGNGATITNGGSAVEGTGINFQVTVAGTVDVTITGECTLFQIVDSNFWHPTFINITNGLIASRAGTVSTAGLAANFPKLFTGLDGIGGATAAMRMSGIWTPGVDYGVPVASTNLLSVDGSPDSFLYGSTLGRVFVRSDVNPYYVFVRPNYTAGTEYPFEIICGPNTALAADKMQLNIKVSGVWQTAITAFDGSWDPTTDMIFGLSNPYQSSVKNLLCEKLSQSYWKGDFIYWDDATIYWNDIMATLWNTNMNEVI